MISYSRLIQFVPYSFPDYLSYNILSEPIEPGVCGSLYSCNYVPNLDDAGGPDPAAYDVLLGWLVAGLQDPHNYFAVDS